MKQPTQLKARKTAAFIAFIAALIMPSLAVSGAGSDFFGIEPKCSQETCVIGKPVTWTVTITNDGFRSIDYTHVSIYDAINNSKIAEWDSNFNPLNSEKGDYVTSYPTKPAVVELYGKAPPANYRNLFVYYACITNAVTDRYIKARYDSQVFEVCYDGLNFTMPVVRCLSNNNCAKDEVCRFNECQSVKCGPCQYILNNSCRDYKCCSSSQCSPYEYCSSHQCKPLSCGPGEYITNNSCKPIICGFDEYLEDKQCIKLDCKTDEYSFKHTCKPLNCLAVEYVLNRTCKPLNCRENEFPLNHTCVQFTCLFNERYYNHTCAPLDCRFYQKIGMNACISNNWVLAKLLLELPALAA